MGGGWRDRDAGISPRDVIFPVLGNLVTSEVIGRTESWAPASALEEC